VETALGYVPHWSAVAQAFVDAFEEVLNLRLHPGELSSFERVQAERIMAEKYARLQWNARL
jgi:lipoate-protein ligase A